MKLARPNRSRTLISIVSMIDVLMILLVFFMVTSTYLDLGMLPVAERGEESAESAPPDDAASGQGPVMVRIGPDGTLRLRGQALQSEALETALRDLIAGDLRTQVLVLPSGAAPAQALVGVMDAAARVGITRLQVIRLDASP